MPLTRLVDVVVLVRVDMSSHVRTSPLDVSLGLLVGVQSPLLVQLLLVFGEHVLFVFTDYFGSRSVNVFGGEGLFVLDGLDTVLGEE